MNPRQFIILSCLLAPSSRRRCQQHDQCLSNDKWSYDKLTQLPPIKRGFLPLYHRLTCVVDDIFQDSPNSVTCFE
uniref:Putative secreted protein n=1 Tax=Anopheles triannulatus TaxID=58253 RepID=A0A2M4B7H6_9DIPT